MGQKDPSAVPRDGQETERSQSLAGCLVQLAWSLGGLGVLAILWVTIVRERPWTFTLKDALFWAAVLGMMAARHVDVALFRGRTMTGAPATARDVRRYAAGLTAAAAFLWCLAQMLHV